MYAFIILLNEGNFKSIPNYQGPLESGSPLMIGGKEAAILGTGLTRAEAKAKGTVYYNRVSEIHGEECTDWNFQTQDVEACTSTSSNSESDEETQGKRKADTSQDGNRKRPKKSSK